MQLLFFFVIHDLNELKDTQFLTIDIIKSWNSKNVEMQWDVQL